MNRDVLSWCRDCQDCQRAKITKQPAAAVQPIPVPRQRFLHVHVDLVGPLSTARDGNRYLFTMIDRTSRWIEAVPLRDMEAATCADAFVATWVARFGVPGQLTSDRGRQFTSSLWAHVCQQLGIQHSLTTAYHPQSNGMVERCHRQIKDSLRARLAGARWPEHLPWVLLGLRAAPKEESGISSAEVLFGVPLTLPGQFIAAAEPDVPQLLKQLRDVPVIATRAPASPPPSEPPAALQHTDLVYVRVDGSSSPLAPQYRGPYRVCPKGPSSSPSRSATSRTPFPWTGSNLIWVPLLCSRPSRLAVAARLPRATTAAMPPSSLGGGRVEAPVVMRRRFRRNPPNSILM